MPLTSDDTNIKPSPATTSQKAAESKADIVPMWPSIPSTSSTKPINHVNHRGAENLIFVSPLKGVMAKRASASVTAIKVARPGDEGA